MNFIFILLGFIPYYLLNGTSVKVGHILQATYLGIYFFAIRMHTLMQTKGLLKIYNYKIKEPLYLERLLYYPVTPALGMTTLATEAIHGIEYLFVT